MRRIFETSLGVAAAFAAVAALGRATAADGGATFVLELPGDVEPPRIPDDNPLTRAKVALGEKLFFERALSEDRTIACATCHDPRRGFADGRRVARGIHGRFGARNTPSLLNVAYVAKLFLDGRARSLEEQALEPIVNPSEMGLESTAAIASRLAAEPGYGGLFAAAFGDARPTADHAAMALASFERTLVALRSPVDRFLEGDLAAISSSAARGWQVFRTSGGCKGCHNVGRANPLFTEFVFRDVGVGFAKDGFARAQAQAKRVLDATARTPEEGAALARAPESSSLGQFVVTRDERDIGKFRTPSLRNVSQTAPYMHDGSLDTLRAVVDFYDRGGEENPNLARAIQPRGMSEREKADLVAFLEALRSDPSPNFDQAALEKRADEVLGPLP